MKFEIEIESSQYMEETPVVVLNSLTGKGGLELFVLRLGLWLWFTAGCPGTHYGTQTHSCLSLSGLEFRVCATTPGFLSC